MEYVKEALDYYIDVVDDYYSIGAMSPRLADTLLSVLDGKDNSLFIRAYAAFRSTEIEEELKEYNPTTRERWKLRSELQQLSKDIRDIYPSAKELVRVLQESGVLHEALTLLCDHLYEEEIDGEGIEELNGIFDGIAMPELHLKERFVLILRLKQIEEEIGSSAKERIKLVKDKIETTEHLKVLS